MNEEFSTGENLIHRILWASTQAVEEIRLKLENHQDDSRWLNFDPSTSKSAETALMGYEAILSGPLIQHQAHTKLDRMRQIYYKAWSSVMDQIREVIPASDLLVQALRTLKKADEELAEYINDCAHERNKDIALQFKENLIAIADELRRLSEEKSKSKKKKKSRLTSRNAGESYCNISISKDGKKITIGKIEPISFTFRGQKQWEIIDALFDAWMDNFRKAEVGSKSSVKIIFGERGKELFDLIEFETRAEAKLPPKKGNNQYSGYACFIKEKIYTPQKMI